jgi:hypothetical protein
MQGNDNLGNPFNVGDQILVPMTVTAIGVTSQNGVPILGLTAKYTTPNGSTITVATLYSSQVLVSR